MIMMMMLMMLMMMMLMMMLMMMMMMNCFQSPRGGEAVPQALLLKEGLPR